MNKAAEPTPVNVYEYRDTVELPATTTIGDRESFVDKVAEFGEVDRKASTTRRIVIVLQANDLWDLRELVSQVEEAVLQYADSGMFVPNRDRITLLVDEEGAA